MSAAVMGLLIIKISSAGANKNILRRRINSHIPIMII